jgi:hypothetical protein
MSTEDSIQEAEHNRDFARPLRGPYTDDPWPNDGPTEFSWGPGLTPPGMERATPGRGGMYRGTTPRHGRPSARDYDAPGNPGVRVR